jgi:hypothetical protein
MSRFKKTHHLVNTDHLGSNQWFDMLGVGLFLNDGMLQGELIIKNSKRYITFLANFKVILFKISVR